MKNIFIAALLALAVLVPAGASASGDFGGAVCHSSEMQGGGWNCPGLGGLGSGGIGNIYAKGWRVVHQLKNGSVIIEKQREQLSGAQCYPHSLHDSMWNCSGISGLGSAGIGTIYGKGWRVAMVLNDGSLVIEK